MRNLLNTTILNILADFKANNIKTYIVGGAVRDFIRGENSQDLDFCLVGVTNNDLVTEILTKHSDSCAPAVGVVFPCWICDINKDKFDFAVARKEKPSGTKRTDFTLDINNISIEDDLFRRDITINAIAFDIENNCFIDPFNGVADLKNKICRNVSEFFKDDALRVLRAARFIAQFELTPTVELINICKELTPIEIVSNDRVGKELIKLFEFDCKPSKFFNFLREIGWLQYHFIELFNLIGIEQDAKHHPEGDAYNHTLLCMDFANNIEPSNVLLKLAMLCHDFGKATTTTNKNGKIQAIGHDKEVHLTFNMLERLVIKNKVYHKKVALLVELHMIHVNNISDEKIRKTMRQLASVDLLYNDLHNVCVCDKNGRGSDTIVNVDIRLKDATFDITPIVTGATLLKLGLKPSKDIGILVNHALTLQDRGTLTKDNWLTVLKSAHKILKDIVI